MRIKTLSFSLLLLFFFSIATDVLAQSSSAVQLITAHLAPKEIDPYLIQGLKKNQTLYVFVETIQGNLDPTVLIVSAETDLPSLQEQYSKELLDLIETSPTPLLDLPALRDRSFLAWDDDSGPGYSAALRFLVPEDGDYYLGVAGSLSAAGKQTSGDYRMLIGIDEPAILDGSAKPTGEQIAVPRQAALGGSPQVQEYLGSLTEYMPSATIPLYNLNPDDILYLRLESKTEGFNPAIALRDYGKKPVRVANLNGSENQATMEQAFPEGGTQYTLLIQAASQNSAKTGDFRLLAGINAPQVLEGNIEPNSESVLQPPISVKVGLLLQEIINLNQQDEIMKAVATIKMEWTDPKLAFNPDDCLCTKKLYTENSYNKFLEDVKGDWPDFTFFNQQGNRWSQNRLIEIDTSGHVSYLERFSTDFQLDFDWQAYPFDQQDFYIKMDMLYPEDRYRFELLEDYSAIDPGHGEDEFILDEFDTSISSVVASQQIPTSRFTFHFSAPRHLEYYLFRIIIPILLIICVSYVTFFLKDYTRRMEVATGNLLLFIAFSFSIAENYPRMGYLTFLDAIMAITFFINTMVVVYNVYLKWLENKEMREKAERIDKFMDWVYPIAYLVSFGIAVIFFL